METRSFTETVPIRIDADGVWRVGNTRVTVDTIVAAYNEGAAAEEIACQYSSVSLADVYSIISFYLHRQSEVEIYLERRNKQAEKVREENEARFNTVGIRQRLLIRSLK